MTKKAGRLEAPGQKRRREFTEAFRREAVQMLLDGHSGCFGCRADWDWPEPICSTVGSGNSLNVPARSPLRLKRESTNWKSSCTASSANATSLKRWLFSAGKSKRRVRRDQRGNGSRPGVAYAGLRV